MTRYALGHSSAEQERLRVQATYLRGITESIWRTAGVLPGMRVLDVGCGTGDTTFLAADLVGPNGFVVGIDRSADAIGTARQRAQTTSRPNVQFIEGELGAPIADQEPFDAAIGRYVLVHQPDIVAALRSVRDLVLHGGLIAFHEIELGTTHVTDPPSELVERVRSWLREAFRLGGVQLDAVSQMPRYFYEAGLGWPSSVLRPSRADSLRMGRGEKRWVLQRKSQPPRADDRGRFPSAMSPQPFLSSSAPMAGALSSPTILPTITSDGLPGRSRPTC